MENDAFLINVYTKQFRKSGYSTTIATNNEIAAARIKNIAPDLLVLDEDSSGGGASFALRKIKESAGIKEIKMLVLSGFSKIEEPDCASVPSDARCISKNESTAEEIVKEIEKLLN